MRAYARSILLLFIIIKFISFTITKIYYIYIKISIIIYTQIRFNNSLLENSCYYYYYYKHDHYTLTSGKMLRSILKNPLNGES